MWANWLAAQFEVYKSLSKDLFWSLEAQTPTTKRIQCLVK